MPLSISLASSFFDRWRMGIGEEAWGWFSIGVVIARGAWAEISERFLDHHRAACLLSCCSLLASLHRRHLKKTELKHLAVWADGRD